MTQTVRTQDLMGASGYECPTAVDLNGIVAYALEASGVDGTLVLESEQFVQQAPFGLVQLMGSLLYYLAPEAPEHLRLVTYDAIQCGCVEVRGARELTELPDPLVAAAGRLGVKLHLHRSREHSAVLVIVPMSPRS